MLAYFKTPTLMSWSIWLTLLRVSTFVFILNSAAIAIANTECECFDYGPSRKLEITFHYNPRTSEDAVQTCRQNDAWLFTDYSVPGFDLWRSIIMKHWEPVLKQRSMIMFTAPLLKKYENISSHVHLNPPWFDPNGTETISYKNDIYYFVLGFAEMFEGTFRTNHHRVFSNSYAAVVCFREAGACTFRKNENHIYKAGIRNAQSIVLLTNATENECLETCMLFKDEDGECWVVQYSTLTSACTIFNSSFPRDSYTFVEQIGENVYIKDCYDPYTNFEDVMDPGQKQPKAFPLTHYCNIEQTDKFKECSTSLVVPVSMSSAGITYELTPTSVFDTSSPYIIETSVNPLPEILEPSSYIIGTSVNALPEILEPSSYSIETSVNALPELQEPSITLSTNLEITPALPETRVTEMSSLEASVMMSPAVNSTEINMMTKTSVANVSNTATIDATTCDCTCIIHVTSTRDRQEIMSSIIHDLQIDKKNLSKTRRKYRSINVDRRWETLGFGYIGVTMLVLIFGGIILMDIGTLARDFKMMFHNFRQCFVPSQEQIPVGETEPVVLRRSIKPQINLRDLQRYSAMAAAVWPQPRACQVRSKHGRYVRSNKDKMDTREGVKRMNIYSST